MTSCPLVMLWLHISLIYLMKFAITSCELVLTKFNRICDVYYYYCVVLSSCNQDTLSCCGFVIM